MKMTAAALVLSVFAGVNVLAQGRPISVAVTGESNLRTNFVESLRNAGRDEGLLFEVVPRSDATYTIIIAQETSIGAAAAAVIALDRDGEVAASVVRSGRLSGRGAMNASAKELAKKLAVLIR